MTREQYAEGQQLIYEIETVKEQINRIEMLKDRVRETTGEFQKSITIQIGEQYHATPKAIVSIASFLEFLDGEKTVFENKKEELLEKFSAI